jgi:carboxylate-amine ligase
MGAAQRVRIDQVLTFGVEEEFLLADTGTRFSAPRAADVIRKAAQELGDRVRSEFFATQLEVCTEPRLAAADLRADLAQARTVAGAAARRAGCLLTASGCAVLTRHPLPLTDEPRYHAVAERLRPVLDACDSELSGCHVHLGTLDRDEILALSAGLRPWLPAVQAMTASSPFADGRDTGCSSWRGVAYDRWPTVGPAPVLDATGYEQLADTMVADGTVADRAMIYWYARPCEHLPTLEVRVADANADLRTTLLAAVLLRGMATTLLAEARAGAGPAPQPTLQQLVRAHQQAAQHGLHGWIHDSASGGRRTTLAQRLRELAHRAEPGLRAAGDHRLAAELLTDLFTRGTGADRQRADFRTRRSFHDVVDGIAHRTGDTVSTV